MLLLLGAPRGSNGNDDNGNGICQQMEKEHTKKEEENEE